MKKIIALILVLVMMLAVVLTACGEEKIAESTSEQETTRGNEQTGTDKPAETGKNEESSTEPAATTGNPGDKTEETGKTVNGTETEKNGETPKTEREPLEELSEDDYTKVSSPNWALELVASLLGDLALPLQNKEIDFSDAEAFEVTYFKSLPVIFYDFENETFVEGQSDTGLLLDLDLTKLSFLAEYAVDNGDYGSSSVKIYTAEDDDLGDVFVISAPETLTKNLVVDSESMIKITSTLLDLLSSYLASMIDDTDTEYAPLLGATAEDEDDMPVTAYGGEEGTGIPFVTVDDEGKISIDPIVFELINSLVSIFTDEDIADSLNYFSKAASIDILKLFLPKDDSLTPVEFTAPDGETVTAELATIQLNGFMAKMMLLSLANQAEKDDFTSAYNKIYSYLPEEFQAYLPDVSAIVSLIRSAAEEIGPDEGIVINRYIYQGASICDEVVLSGSVIKAIRDSFNDYDDDYYYDDDDYEVYYEDEEYYGEDDEDDGEWDGEWDDGEWEEPEMLYGTMRLEYYNGVGRYTFVETYSEEEEYLTRDYSFGKDEDGYYFESNDFFEINRTEFAIDENGYTLTVYEVETDDMPDVRTNSLRIEITQDGKADLCVKVTKTGYYKYYYEIWTGEGEEYEVEVEEGSSESVYRFEIKAIDPFTNTLEEEVKNNRYDISNMMGVMELYNEIYEKYGFIINALINGMSGGDYYD